MHMPLLLIMVGPTWALLPAADQGGHLIQSCKALGRQHAWALANLVRSLQLL